MSRAANAVIRSSLGEKLKTKDSEIKAEQGKRLAIWRTIYKKYGIDLKAQTIMGAIHELDGDPSVIKQGKIPKGKTSHLNYSTQLKIAKEIDRATAHLKIKELFDERKEILEKIATLKKKLARQFLNNEIDKLFSASKEADKKVIKNLIKAKGLEI